MNIDFGKIREIYGEDALVACNDNLDDLVKNINYLINDNKIEGEAKDDEK